jgi:hypothetical protein
MIGGIIQVGKVVSDTIAKNDDRGSHDFGTIDVSTDGALRVDEAIATASERSLLQAKGLGAIASLELNGGTTSGTLVAPALDSPVCRDLGNCNTIKWTS